MLTIDQIKAYLATKRQGDVVGRPCHCFECLAASTLNWLQPGSMARVLFTNEEALLKGGEIVEFSPELTAVANKFDQFPGKRKENVTLSELEEYMPELFNTETR